VLIEGSRWKASKDDSSGASLSRYPPPAQLPVPQRSQLIVHSRAHWPLFIDTLRHRLANLPLWMSKIEEVDCRRRVGPT